MSTCLSENNHVQYSDSDVYFHQLIQFFYQCVRCDNHDYLEERLHNMLKKSKNKERNYIRELTILYVLIGQTRDIAYGKGEYRLAYMLIYVWYQYYPELALFAFKTFVLPQQLTYPVYGSWKDVKFFCDYLQKRDVLHPLIRDVCDILINQLKLDQENLRKRKLISLAGKWCPREKKKYGWLYDYIAFNFTPHIIQTAKSPFQYHRALTKTRMLLRKHIAKCNFILNTTQVAMCDNKWDVITNPSSRTTFKNRHAFANINKDGSIRSDDPKRIECGKRFQNSNLNGRHCEMYELVKAALETNNQVEEQMINRLWEKEGMDLGNTIAIVDVSLTLEEKDKRGFYTGIGLGIRAAESSESAFKNRLITFSAVAKWLNLDECSGFVEKVKLVKASQEGMQANLYKAIDMLLKTFVEEADIGVATFITLLIISDMQLNPQSMPLYEGIRNRFKKAASANKTPYKMPYIYFWNTRQTKGYPVAELEPKTAMISGYSDALMKVFAQKIKQKWRYPSSPYLTLRRITSNNRYKPLRKKIREYFA
jgi:hypothetical protein